MKTLTSWVQKSALFFVCMSMAALPVHAQETTSSMRGQLLSADGAPVSGAQITIIHTPSGSTSFTTTNADGTFSSRNLRVGGPYAVQLRAREYRNQTVENIFIGLGEAYALNVALARGVNVTEEIVVTGVAIGGEGLTYGGGSNFTSEDIDGLPSISRDLKDVIRSNPLVYLDPTNEDAFHIAGVNNRFNSITVDGIKQNDDFGLNDNGYPTQRSPINIDAVEAVSVLTSPFEVTYNGFTGGTVNMVTKSGTNDLSGSAYYYRTTNDLAGDTSKGQDVTLSEFNEETYGLTLGGPLLEDKLFFFASYDKFERVGTGLQFGPQGSSFPTTISGVTQSDIDAVRAIMTSVYNFDPLDISDLAAFPQTDEKLLLKLDANLSEDHRIQGTYQYTNGNTFTEGFSSTSNPSLALPSQGYNRGERLEVWNVQLFSDWTQDFSTEIKVGRKTNDTTQAALAGNDFAQFEVELPQNVQANGRIPSIFLGPDIFRHGNALANETLQLKIKGDYYLGDHLITAGYEMEDLDVFNLFVANSEGSYVFNNLTDLQNRVASSFSYTNAVGGDENDAAATFGLTTHAVYLQDSWDPTDELSLVGGLRYEWYASSDTPRLNPTFQSTYGFGNDRNLDGLDILMPRVGFNYTPSQVDGLTVRGGAGLFSGGNPNVWIANSYSNDGVTVVNANLAGLDPAVYLTNVDGFAIPDAVNATLQPGNGATNFIFETFDIPSSWKYNLAFEYDWQGYQFAAEALWSEVKDAVVWNDIQNGPQIGISPVDGRAIYAGRGRNVGDLGITTRGEGHNRTYSISVRKAYENLGLDVYAAYAFTDAEDLQPATSSIAGSNHGRVAAIDRENLTAETSNYEVRHRFVGSIDWQHEFVADAQTRFSLFATSQSGNPYSFTYNDGNAPSIFGNASEYTRRDTNLFYVPEFNGDVVLNGIDQGAFQAFLNDTGLSEYAGQIAPRNAFRMPWQTRVDLRIAQEVPSYFDGHNIEFSLAFENFTNFLNSDWGQVVDTPDFWQVRQIVAVSQNAQGQYVYSNFNPNELRLDGDGSSSLWAIQFGVKYRF